MLDRSVKAKHLSIMATSINISKIKLFSEKIQLLLLYNYSSSSEGTAVYPQIEASLDTQAKISAKAQDERKYVLQSITPSQNQQVVNSIILD